MIRLCTRFCWLFWPSGKQEEGHSRYAYSYITDKEKELFPGSFHHLTPWYVSSLCFLSCSWSGRDSQALRTLSGRVQLVEELFGVTIERTENSHTWHPDVQFYSLKKEGAQKAFFYLDPYSRPAGVLQCAPQVAFS